MAAKATRTAEDTTPGEDVAAEAAGADPAASSTESSVALGINPGHRSRDQMQSLVVKYLTQAMYIYLRLKM
jgi:hypothetical protein